MASQVLVLSLASLTHFIFKVAEEEVKTNELLDNPKLWYPQLQWSVYHNQTISVPKNNHNLKNDTVEKYLERYFLGKAEFKSFSIYVMSTFLLDWEDLLSVLIFTILL